MLRFNKILTWTLKLVKMIDLILPIWRQDHLHGKIFFFLCFNETDYSNMTPFHNISRCHFTLLNAFLVWKRQLFKELLSLKAFIIFLIDSVINYLFFFFLDCRLEYVDRRESGHGHVYAYIWRLIFKKSAMFCRGQVKIYNCLEFGLLGQVRFILL